MPKSYWRNPKSLTEINGYTEEEKSNTEGEKKSYWRGKKSPEGEKKTHWRKLDGVGPVDHQPSTDYLHPFVILFLLDPIGSQYIRAISVHLLCDTSTCSEPDITR